MKKISRNIILTAASIVALNACNNAKKEAQAQKDANTEATAVNPPVTDSITASGLNVYDFDTTYTDDIQGKKDVKLFVLKNTKGMEVCVTNFGGRVVSIVVPDKNGKPTDVVLGYPTASDYFPENNQSDFGSSVGRYANRIKDGKLPINGDTIQLAQNNFGHCLHGGLHGWMYQVYDANQIDGQTLELNLTAPDGENDFPGEVKVKVTMKVTEDNGLDIAYEGETNKPTVLNMTNHSYFNLNGDPTQPITNCVAQINAANYTPTDNTYMTTGEIVPVAGTTFDFTQPKVIGQDFIGQNVADALKAFGDDGEDHTGYDHNWVLDTYKDGKGDDTKVCATVYSPVTGIQLDVYTNEPGIQFYTGNFQNGTVVGKKGIKYPKNAAFCLETQKYPNAPQNPQWPTCQLNPGEKYYSHCVYKFSIRK